MVMVMVMDGRQVVENLDALWFFGTVFSSHTTTPSAIQNLENSTPDNVEDQPSREDIATPILPNESPIGGNLVQKTLEDGGFRSEMKTEVENPTRETEREEKRRRSRTGGRRSCLMSHRRKVVGEMDLSFSVKEVCEGWLLKQMSGHCHWSENQKKKKMPPFEDSMAMKEHIRSWAYAVACTVR